VMIPENWLGKTVAQIDIRKKYHINIMGIKRGKQLDLTITPDTILSQGQTMMVLGSYRDIQKCFRI